MKAFNKWSNSKNTHSIRNKTTHQYQTLMLLDTTIPASSERSLNQRNDSRTSEHVDLKLMSIRRYSFCCYDTMPGILLLLLLLLLLAICKELTL